MSENEPSSVTNPNAPDPAEIPAETGIGALNPDLSAVARENAKEQHDRYLEVVWRIFERTEREERQFLTPSELPDTMESQRSNPVIDKLFSK